MKRFILNTLLAIGLVFVLNSCSINDTESDDIRFEMEYYLSEIIVDGKHYERIVDVDKDNIPLVEWIEKETGTLYSWYYDNPLINHECSVDTNGYISYINGDDKLEYLTDKNDNKLIDFKFHIGNICNYFIKRIIKNAYNHKIQLQFATDSYLECPYFSYTIRDKGDILTINYNEEDFESEYIQSIKEKYGLAVLPNSYKFIRQGDSYRSTVNYKNSDGSERKVEFIYTATKPLRIIP